MADDVATPEQVKAFSAWTPQQWINEAWGTFPATTPASLRALYAWAYLQALRRPGEPSAAAQQLGITGIPTIPGADKFANLAYAEHYMYARYVVAETGDIKGEDAMILGYEGRKVGAFVTKGQDDLKIGKYNPTPPSIDAVNWGLKGAEQGLKDYRDVHGNVEVPFGPAIKKDEELLAKQMKLTPQQKKQLDDTLQKVIDTQTTIERIKRIMEIMKSIKGFLPKGVSDVCTPCAAQSNSVVETSVSGKVMNPSGSTSSGTAV